MFAHLKFEKYVYPFCFMNTRTICLKCWILRTMPLRTEYSLKQTENCVRFEGLHPQTVKYCSAQTSLIVVYVWVVVCPSIKIFLGFSVLYECTVISWFSMVSYLNTCFAFLLSFFLTYWHWSYLPFHVFLGPFIGFFIFTLRHLDQWLLISSDEGHFTVRRCC